jgi:hypothetical protein
MIRKKNYEVEINLIDCMIKNLLNYMKKNLKIILLKKENYDNIKIKNFKPFVFTFGMDFFGVV